MNEARALQRKPAWRTRINDHAESSTSRAHCVVSSARRDGSRNYLRGGQRSASEIIIIRLTPRFRSCIGAVLAHIHRSSIHAIIQSRRLSYSHNTSMSHRHARLAVPYSRYSAYTIQPYSPCTIHPHTPPLSRNPIGSQVERWWTVHVDTPTIVLLGSLLG